MGEVPLYVRPDCAVWRSEVMSCRGALFISRRYIYRVTSSQQDSSPWDITVGDRAWTSPRGVLGGGAFSTTGS